MRVLSFFFPCLIALFVIGSASACEYGQCAVQVQQAFAVQQAPVQYVQQQAFVQAAPVYVQRQVVVQQQQVYAAPTFAVQRQVYAPQAFVQRSFAVQANVGYGVQSAAFVSGPVVQSSVVRARGGLFNRGVVRSRTVVR
jgi:hypothetical protein